VKLRFHEADRATSAHNPTSAQLPADFRRRDEIHLDLKRGREFPKPRVAASAGDNVTSNMAASIPPWMKPAGFKNSARACISTLIT
jgi:hypothetical protein